MIHEIFVSFLNLTFSEIYVRIFSEQLLEFPLFLPEALKVVLRAITIAVVFFPDRF